MKALLFIVLLLVGNSAFSQITPSNLWETQFFHPGQALQYKDVTEALHTCMAEGTKEHLSLIQLFELALEGGYPSLSRYKTIAPKKKDFFEDKFFWLRPRPVNSPVFTNKFWLNYNYPNIVTGQMPMVVALITPFDASPGPASFNDLTTYLLYLKSDGKPMEMMFEKPLPFVGFRKIDVKDYDKKHPNDPQDVDANGYLINGKMFEVYIGADERMKTGIPVRFAKGRGKKGDVVMNWENKPLVLDVEPYIKCLHDLFGKLEPAPSND